MQPVAPLPMPGVAYPPPRPSPLRRAGVIVGAVLVILGGLVMWGGYVWAYVFPPQNPGPGTGRLIVGLLYTGAITGFGGSLIAAFASPREDGMQKLGLFLLAAVFVFALVAAFWPTYYFP